MKDRKTDICHFIIFGDSASDLGVSNSKWLYRKIANLNNTSPLGRFSNARNWIDHLSTEFCHLFSIKDAKNHGKSPTDIADGIINKDKKITCFFNPIHTSPRGVWYQDTCFFRSYAEGGTTAHNYQRDVCTKTY